MSNNGNEQQAQTVLTSPNVDKSKWQSNLPSSISVTNSCHTQFGGVSPMVSQYRLAEMLKFYELQLQRPTQIFNNDKKQNKVKRKGLAFINRERYPATPKQQSSPSRSLNQFATLTKGNQRLPFSDTRIQSHSPTLLKSPRITKGKRFTSLCIEQNQTPKIIDALIKDDTSNEDQQGCGQQFKTEPSLKTGRNLTQLANQLHKSQKYRFTETQITTKNLNQFVTISPLSDNNRIFLHDDTVNNKAVIIKTDSKLAQKQIALSSTLPVVTASQQIVRNIRSSETSVQRTEVMLAQIQSINPLAEQLESIFDESKTQIQELVQQKETFNQAKLNRFIMPSVALKKFSSPVYQSEQSKQCRKVDQVQSQPSQNEEAERIDLSQSVFSSNKEVKPINKTVNQNYYSQPRTKQVDQNLQNSIIQKKFEHLKTQQSKNKQKGTCRDVTYEEIMSFSFDQDFLTINNRLDRLKKKKLQMQNGFKQTGILKIGESEFLPSIEPGIGKPELKTISVGIASRRNTLNIVKGAIRVRFKIDTEQYN